MKQYSWKNKEYALLSCLLFIGIWQVIAVIVNNDIYIPRIEDVLKSLLIIVKEKNFLKIILCSFYRTSISYFSALILAMVLGVLSNVCPFFKYFIKPLNWVIRTIPTLVLIVLALVWFNKDIAPFVVGFAISFPILYEGVIESIGKIDNKIIDMTKIYEVSLSDKIIKVYFPVMKFYFMSVFVSIYSLAFKVVIAGEVHGQPKYGIGSQVQLEKVNFNTPAIFAWIIIIMIISLIFELINKMLNKRVYRWSE